MPKTLVTGHIAILPVPFPQRIIVPISLSLFNKKPMEYFHSSVFCGVSVVFAPVKKQVNPIWLAENKLFMFDTILGFEAEFCASTLKNIC